MDDTARLGGFPFGETRHVGDGQMAVHECGRGPDMVLFHGGMGSWRHWIRNIEPLAEHFRVHALDLPGYGDSAAVERGIAPERYFDLVHGLLEEALPGRGPIHAAGFSFGAVVASAVLPRLGKRVLGFSLIGPSGFGPPRTRTRLDTVSYRQAGGDPDRLAEIMRQNLLAVMLLHSASIDDEVLRLQAENVRLHKGMNSRDVSILDRVPHAVGSLECPVQLIIGAEDQVARDELAERIERCRAQRPDLTVHVLPDTGHWAMFENASAVNARLLEFHRAI